ncbi:portal protein [Endozoicomonas arenosclerae]|uniref:portal protein n=1 Tax=Endozoicomonas arenosclerae TaxID=1633495 RepID=UPI0007842750|nr:hypothetical protein [Endozoicomonas arenosclerae]
MENTLTEEQIDKLQELGLRLQKTCEENANKRHEVDERMLEDLRQFHGEYDSKLKSELEASGGSQLFRNETRPKCRVASAQLSKMLLPTDDRNFGVEPTPVPDAEGRELSKEQANKIKEASKEAAEKMQRQIDDDFTESGYHEKCRKIIKDAVKTGTGIIKGPVIVNRTRQAWVKSEDGEHVLQSVVEPRPGIEYVSPWNFYPDMSACALEDAEFIFEKLPWTKRKLREFAKLEGVNQEAVKELLNGGAQSTHSSIKDYTNELREITGVSSIMRKSLYDIWLYTGPVTRDELIVCGCEFEEDDDQEEYDALIWFANGKVLKAVINPLDTGEYDYSVFCWEEDDSCIFGFGVPYQLRHPQKGTNAAWRMLFDNAGLSAGPQIVIDESAVEPVNGVWKLEPRKIWRKKQNLSEGHNTPFEVHNIDCNQPMLAALLDLTGQAGDEEANIPLIAQGEQDSATTKTMGGMQLLANAALTVFQEPVKHFDDGVIRTMVKRFYDYQMQYGSDSSIKGDYQIKARGSSVLLLREVQAQALMQFLSLAQNDPEIRKRTDFSKLVPEIKKAMQMTAAGIVIDEDQVKANEKESGQQQDPNIMAAQIQLQLKKKEMEFKQQLELRKLDQDRELRMYAIAAANDMKLNELEQKLGIEEQKIQAQRDIAALSGTLKQNEINLKAETGSGI